MAARPLRRLPLSDFADDITECQRRRGGREGLDHRLLALHRELVEAIERRGQQVWIPVTVATLVPGVLLLAVPFVEAMRLFTSG